MATTVEELESLIQSVRAEAEKAADSLEAAALTLPWQSFGERNGFTLARYTPIDKGDLPVLEELPTEDINQRLKDMNPDTYKGHVFESEFLDDLSDTIKSVIDSGGVGFSSSTQNAIYTTGSERRRARLNDDLDMILAGAGSRGLMLPRGIEYAMRNELIQKEADDQLDINRKIIEDMAQRAADNIKSAMDHGIRVEDIHRQFAIDYAKLYFDITRQIVDVFKVQQETLISKYEGELRGKELNVRIDQTNAELDQKDQEMLLKQWDLDRVDSTERTKALIQQLLSETQMKLSAFQYLTQFWQASVMGISGTINNIDTTSRTE